jgi:hypothetical protein
MGVRHIVLGKKRGQKKQNRMFPKYIKNLKKISDINKIPIWHAWHKNIQVYLGEGL